MIRETLILDDQASPKLQSLAMKANAAAAAMGAGGLGGSIGQTAQGLAGLAGALGLAILGLSIATGGAIAMGRALLDMTRSAGANADALLKLGRVTDEEARAVKGATAALVDADRASEALQVTMVSLLAPAVTDIAGIMEDASESAQDLGRWLGSGSLEGSIARGALLAVTGLGSLGVALDGLRALIPRQAPDRVDPDAARKDAAAKDLTAAERELMAARVASSSSLQERERLSVALKEAEIGALAEAYRAEGLLADERDAIGARLAAREAELAGMRAKYESERKTAHEAEMKRIGDEADALLRTRALVAQTIDSGIRGANASRLGAFAGQTGAGTSLGASNASAAATFAGGGNDPNQALRAQVEAHRSATAQISGLWSGAASTIVDSLGGAFAKTEQAQKRAALVSIAVSTAVAIMQTFAAYGFTPVGWAAAGAMAGIGAAQAIAAATATQGGVKGGGAAFAGTGTSQSASQLFEPSAQSGSGGDNGGSSGGGMSRRRNEVTIRTVGGYAPVRDLVEALNRGGAKLRLEGA